MASAHRLGPPRTIISIVSPLASCTSSALQARQFPRFDSSACRQRQRSNRFGNGAVHCGSDGARILGTRVGSNSLNLDGLKVQRVRLRGTGKCENGARKLRNNLHQSLRNVETPRHRSRTSCAAEGEGGGGAVAAVETAQTARKGGGVSRRATETITASKVSAEGDTARAFGPRRSRGGGGGSGEDGEAEIGEAISATSPLSPIIAVDEFFSLPSLALPPAPPGRALESLVFMLAEAGKAEDEEEWGEEAEDWGEINWGEEGEWNAGGEGQGQREGRGIEVFWASDVRSVRGGDETPPPAPYSAPSSPSPPSPPTSASSAPLPLPPPHLVLSHLRSASLAPCVLLPAAPALPGPGEGEEGVGGGADGRSARAEREAQGSGAAQVRVVAGRFRDVCTPPPLTHFLMLHVYMRPGTAVNIPLDRTQSALIYVLEGVAMFGPRGEAVFQNEGHSLLFPAAPSGASSVTSDAVSEMDKETDSTVGGAAGVGARGDEEDWIRVESHSWGGVEFVLVAGQS